MKSQQCPNLAPVHGLQCTKPAAHVRAEDLVMHQNGSLVWGSADPPRRLRFAPESEFNVVDEAHQHPDSELHRWWLDQAHAEVEPLLAKAAEYGGTGQAMDLIDIGRNVARLAGREVGDAEATEIGCAFYAHGKMARIMAAISEGRRASDDSWYDLGIYVRMVQRTRAAGGWPGLNPPAGPDRG